MNTGKLFRGCSSFYGRKVGALKSPRRKVFCRFEYLKAATKCVCKRASINFYGLGRERKQRNFQLKRDFTMISPAFYLSECAVRDVDENYKNSFAFLKLTHKSSECVDDPRASENLQPWQKFFHFRIVKIASQLLSNKSLPAEHLSTASKYCVCTLCNTLPSLKARRGP